jgi:hypothetical protein
MGSMSLRSDMKRFLILGLVCLGLGAGGGFYASQTFGSTLFSGMMDIEGVVVEKGKEGSRLVLSIENRGGNRFLASFTKRRTEVDQLVNEGDRITIRVPRDRTLADNPAIVRVTKPEEHEGEGTEEHASDHGSQHEPERPSLHFTYGLPADAGSIDGGLTAPRPGAHEPTELADAADAGTDASAAAAQEVSLAVLVARAAASRAGHEAPASAEHEAPHDPAPVSPSAMDDAHERAPTATGTAHERPAMGASAPPRETAPSAHGSSTMGASAPAHEPARPSESAMSGAGAHPPHGRTAASAAHH